MPDFGYTSAKIWLKLPIANQSADQEDWHFFVHANFNQTISVTQINADGSVKTLMDLGQDSPFSARPFNYPQMVVPFELGAGETATLIVSYYSQGSSRLSMSIETQKSFAAIASVAQAKQYTFYGMMLIMIVLSVIALTVIKQGVFAAYTGYLLSMLVYVAHVDGVAFQYVWPNLPRFNSMASIVAGSGVIVCACLFAILYLQTKRFHPLMHRLLGGYIALFLILVGVLWAIDPQTLKRVLVVLLSISTIICFSAGAAAARKRFTEVKFYLFAYGAALIPAILFTARFAFGFEPSFISTYDAVRLALIVDALMMGMAIFYRYNYLRQSAMEESLAQANRNLALSQRLGLLEGQYEQVTLQSLRREENVKDTIHDLRQPMQALRLSLRQMIDPVADNTNDAGQIESALAYMERLVAGRLAQSEPHQLELDATTAGDSEPGLHEVLRGIAEMFAGEAAAKGLTLKLILAAPDCMVDAFPLMRVVANLTSNAIKYTKQGRVIIALRRHGSGHKIEVHDTGPGLAGANFNYALQRNQRLDRDLHAAEGSGLGLSVVNETVASSGWKISSCAARTTGASIRVTL